MNTRLICALLFSSAASLHAGVVMTPLLTWSIDGWLSPAEYDPLNSTGMGNADTTRGMACNPVTGRVIVVTRKGGFSVRALDGVRGDELHEMQPPAGGYIGTFFPINMCAVADDGGVFVNSLASPNSSAALRVYRWANDNADTVPDVVFNATGVSPNRLGDDIAAIGAGVTTQLVFGESHNVTTADPRNSFAVLTTADGVSFSGSLIAFAGTPPNPGDFRLGINFIDPDTVIGSQGGSLRIADFTGTTGTLVTVTPSPPVTPTQRPLDYAVVGGRPLLATVETSTSIVRVFDMTVPTAPTLAAQGNTTTPPVVANGGLGSVSWGPVIGNTATLYAMNSNNGIQAFTVTVTADATAPAVTTNPANRSAYARGQTTFSVEATGTPPLSYQWFKEDMEIPNATAASYTINPVSDGSTGTYKCRVSNVAPPAAESTPATLTVVPSVDTTALTETWHLSPGSRPYLGTADQERGMDYHSGNNHLYVVSRSTSPPSVRVLDAANGADLYALDTETDPPVIAAGTPPGTYLLNMVGVGSDGVVYAASLSNEAGADLAIYKWANDNAVTEPEEVYRGNPIGRRIGDSMDVRGSGPTTQILFGSRRAKSYVVFTPLGDDFEPHVVEIAEAADEAFGHSIAFGEGNSVWGKVQGQGIVRSTFTPGATPADPWTGVLTAGFTAPAVINAIGPIGIDAVEGCLLGLENGNSDNARLYDLPLPFPDPAPADLTLLDQEFLFTDNANDNGVGSVAVAGGKAFVLGTNNGLTAYTVVKLAPPSAPPVLTLESRTGDTLNMKLKGTVGKSYQMEKSSALSPAAAWTADGAPIVLVTEEQTVTRTITAGEIKLFYRAREATLNKK